MRTREERTLSLLPSRFATTLEVRMYLFLVFFFNFVFLLNVLYGRDEPNLFFLSQTGTRGSVENILKSTNLDRLEEIATAKYGIPHFLTHPLRKTREQIVCYICFTSHLWWNLFGYHYCGHGKSLALSREDWLDPFSEFWQKMSLS